MCSSMKNSTQIIVTAVKEADVLSGRGGKTNKHYGNRIFRRLVKENRALYQETKNNSRKQLLAESIIATIHQRGGRFLKRVGKDTHAWVELTKDEANIKTTQALREIPSGTSSRALNVERMLEQKRMKRRTSSSHGSTTSFSGSDSDSRLIPAAALPARADASSFHQSNVEHEYHSAAAAAAATTTTKPAAAESSNNDMLSDEELESLINDSDTYDTIVSLLDKTTEH